MRARSDFPYFLAAGFILCLFSSQIVAQDCPHSHIYLIIHDEHGRVIDAQPFSKRMYSANSFGSVQVEKLQPHKSVTGDYGQVNALVYGSSACAFESIEETTFEFGRKRMKLIFRNAIRGRPHYSTQYTIDTPVFREGTYEVDLSSTRGLRSGPRGLTSSDTAHLVFDSSAWRKIDGNVPNFRGPHKIGFAGTVLNSVTHLPISGAAVELRQEEKIWDVTTTDSNGNFELEKATDEQLSALNGRIFLRSAPKDFAPTEVYIDDFRHHILSREKFHNISIGLLPLVSVNGRMINEAIGRAPVLTEGVFKAFSYIDNGFTIGDYRTRQYYTTQADVSTEGRFRLTVAVGKNMVSVADYQKYHRLDPGTLVDLLDKTMVVDIKTLNSPDIVVRVR